MRISTPDRAAATYAHAGDLGLDWVRRIIIWVRLVTWGFIYLSCGSWLCRECPRVLAFANAYVMIFKSKKLRLWIWIWACPGACPGICLGGLEL